jgi:hypothetical protein
MDGIPLIYDVATDEVAKFKNTGEFDNNQDSYGNMQLVFSSAQSMDGNKNYVKIPLKTFSYNEVKILDSSETTFTEFETEEEIQERNLDEVLEQYNILLAENKILNETVNALVGKYENSDDKQVIEAQKSTIINLRIQLGQGNTIADFSRDFPFLPLT